MGKGVGRIIGDVFTGGLAEPLYYGPQDAAQSAADAAQGAATAQQQQARQNYNHISGLLEGASTQSLAQMDSALSQQQKNIDQQLELVKQIDPTIMQASQNALALLKGQQSSYLAPIQAQRNEQRQQLLNTLRQQMGAGAETSTAGMQALNNFDMQTNSLMSQQQQGALSLMGNIGGQFSGMRPNIGGQISELGGLAQNRYGIVANQAGLLNNAANPMMQTAGAEYTGQSMRANADMNMYKNMGQLAMTGAGFMLGGPGGGKAAGTLGGQMMPGAAPSNGAAMMGTSGGGPAFSATNYGALA